MAKKKKTDSAPENVTTSKKPETIAPEQQMQPEKPKQYKRHRRYL